MKDHSREVLLKLLKKRMQEERHSDALSAIQLSFWWHQFQHPESHAYNVVISVKLSNKVKARMLESAWDVLCKNHPALLTYYPLIQHQPHAVLHKLSKTKIKSLKLVSLKKFTQSPFDLKKDYLYRLGMMRLNEKEQVLVIVLHHINVDLWSVNILLNGMFNNFSSELEESSYTVFIDQEEKLINSQKGRKQLHYWKKQLKDVPLKTMISPDFVSDNLAIVADTINIDISSKIQKSFHEFLKNQNLTLNIGYLALWFMVIYKQTHQEDLVIGSTAARRENLTYANTVGCFINPIALRLHVNPKEKAKDIFLKISDLLKEAVLNQDYPFSKIVSELKVPRILGVSPLFQIGYELEQQRIWDEIVEAANDLHLAPYDIDQQEGQLDLSLRVIVAKEKTTLSFKFNSQLYRKETMEWLGHHYRYLIENVNHYFEKEIESISLSDKSENKLTLYEWNKTEKPLAEKTYVDIFKEIVKKYPDQVALEYQNQEVTYQALDQTSNKVAAFLQKNFNKKGIVAVWMEKSIELITSLVGIGKAAQAYLPLELDLPDERVQYIIQQSQAHCLITFQKYEKKLQKMVDKNCQILCFEKLVNGALPYVEKPPNFHDTAYVIYTSGTTGQPKGVAIPFSGMINRLIWMQRKFSITSANKILQKTPITFDVSVWEIFLPLISGSTLVIAEQGGHLDPVYLGELIQNKKISDLHFVPTMLDIFIEQGRLENLHQVKHIYCSGEKLSTQTVQSVLKAVPSVKVYNLYGPTEASVDVSDCYCDPQLVFKWANIPIGKPIDNVKLYVLNQNQQPCAIGEPGELYISGICLASGYLNNPELTQKAFIFNPFEQKSDYQRMYKTGDLIKWSSEGRLEYLGRNDRQIKIRGFRVELTEVESTIKRYPGVDQCVAVVKKINNEDHIISYFTTKNEKIIISELKAFLSHQLPFYMIPTEFILLKKMPITLSGKIDIQKLLHIEKQVPILKGKVPLTPIQVWFFDQPIRERSHWNLSFLFESAVSLNQEILKQAFESLILQHDSLRLRFSKSNSWNQFFESDEKGFSIDLKSYQLTKKQILKECEKIQESLHITRGPIMRAAIFYEKNKKTAYLFIAIHHLVVDAVSWRILLEDLTGFYQKISNGNPVLLKQKTSSYQEWSQALRKYKISKHAIEYWKARAQLFLKETWPTVRKNNRPYYKNECIFASPSINLLQAQPNLMQSAVLLALMQSYQKTFGINHLLVDREHFGRDDIPPNLDLTRTVGWFTNIIPIQLIAKKISTEVAISTIQQTIETDNQHGLGYEILKYLKKVDWLNKIDSKILFNYLGNVSGFLRSDLFRMSELQAFESNIESSRFSSYPIIVNLFFYNKQLRAYFLINPSFISKNKSSEWIKNFKSALKNISRLYSTKSPVRKVKVSGSDIEKKLVALWRSVLPVKTISPQDNFFALGGDSLLTIQLASRAKASGINLSPRMIYTFPTIAELAKQKDLFSLPLETGVKKKTTEKLYLPRVYQTISHYQLSKADYNYYHTSITVKLKQKINTEDFKQIINVLNQSYDILKLRLKTNNQFNLILDTKSKNLIYFKEFFYDKKIDFDDLYQENLESLKKILNIESGPVLIFSIFRNPPDGKDRLLILSNHFMFDLYSLNLILRDIYLLFKAARNDKLIKIEAASYVNWLNQLKNEKVSADRISYWRKLATQAKPFPVDMDFFDTRAKNLRDDIFVLLESKDFLKLIKLCREEINCSMSEVLLTAFVIANVEIYAQQSLTLHVTNSGRESLNNYVLANMVGRATAVVPMYFKNIEFDFSNRNTLIKIIQEVTKEVDYANNHPFEFDLLANSSSEKRLEPLSSIRAAFIYLGRMRDNYLAFEDLYGRADEYVGPDWQPDTKIHYQFYAYTAIYDEKLIFISRYSQKNYHHSTMEKITQSMQKILSILLK